MQPAFGNRSEAVTGASPLIGGLCHSSHVRDGITDSFDVMLGSAQQQLSQSRFRNPECILLDPRSDQALLRNLSITEGIECPRFRFISSSACVDECCGIRKPTAGAWEGLRFCILDSFVTGGGIAHLVCAEDCLKATSRFGILRF